MKYLFSLMLMLGAFQTVVASAEKTDLLADDRVLICSPSETSRNGHGLAWARIEISSENPEADLYYRFSSRDPRRARKTFHMHYDTVGDGSEYELTPDSQDPSALFIGVKKISRKRWEATFINQRNNTISVLPCTEGEPSPIRG